MPSYSTKSVLLNLNSRDKSDRIFWCSPMNYIKQSPSFIFLAGILQEPVVTFSLFLWIYLFDLKAAEVFKRSNYFCFSIKYSVSPQKILFASSQQKKTDQNRTLQYATNECVGSRVPGCPSLPVLRGFPLCRTCHVSTGQSPTQPHSGSPCLVAGEKACMWQWMPASKSCNFSPPLEARVFHC